MGARDPALRDFDLHHLVDVVQDDLVAVEEDDTLLTRHNFSQPSALT